MPRPPVYVVLLAVLWLKWSPSASAAETSEYEYKAAFLYNIMKFVQWPESALGEGKEALIVAVLGAGAAPEIERTLNGKSVQGRPVVVESHSKATTIGRCHVLFIKADATSVHQEVLSAMEGRPVLTVSELKGHQASAMITLLIKRTKLTFDVDLDAIEAHDMRVSVNLLDLAANVRSTRLKRRPS